MGNGLFFTDVSRNNIDGTAVRIGVDNVTQTGVDFFAGCQSIFCCRKA